MRIIAGEWKGHPIQAPSGGRTRPTTDRVREAWMSMMQPVLRDARVLDLFAGSGSLGLEAVSRGARFAAFVERNGGVLRTLRSNIKRLGAESRTTVVRADALTFLDEVEPGDYDVIVADPPYGSGEAAALAELFLREPVAGSLWIEHRVSDRLPDAETADSRRYGDTMITRYLGME